MASDIGVELMTQAMEAFEQAGADPSMRPLALSSLHDPQQSQAFSEALEAFCLRIVTIENAELAQTGLALASRAVLERKAALVSASATSRRSTDALFSYLQNSDSEE